MYKTTTITLQKQNIMKRKFTTIALALVAALGIGAAAQTPDAATCPKGTKQAKECRHGAPQQACANRDSMEMAVFFEGITLTPEQQTKITTLRQNNRQQARESKALARQQRADRAKARKDAQRSKLNEMKSILTPEQYVVYLENIVVNAPAGPRMHDGRDMKRPHRDAKAMNSTRPAKNAGRQAR